jgi:hypothetical protein
VCGVRFPCRAAAPGWWCSQWPHPQRCQRSGPTGSQRSPRCGGVCGPPRARGARIRGSIRPPLLRRRRWRLERAGDWQLRQDLGTVLQPPRLAHHGSPCASSARPECRFARPLRAIRCGGAPLSCSPWSRRWHRWHRLEHSMQGAFSRDRAHRNATPASCDGSSAPRPRTRGVGRPGAGRCGSKGRGPRRENSERSSLSDASEWTPRARHGGALDIREARPRAWRRACHGGVAP